MKNIIVFQCFEVEVSFWASPSMAELTILMNTIHMFSCPKKFQVLGDEKNSKRGCGWAVLGSCMISSLSNVLKNYPTKQSKTKYLSMAHFCDLNLSSIFFLKVSFLFRLERAGKKEDQSWRLLGCWRSYSAPKNTWFRCTKFPRNERWDLISLRLMNSIQQSSASLLLLVIQYY